MLTNDDKYDKIELEKELVFGRSITHLAGAFQTSREIFSNSIWRNIVEFRLFFLIYGHATFKNDVKLHGLTLKRGQWLRSYRNLQEDLEYIENRSVKKYSLSVLKRAIDNLVKDNRLKIEVTELGTLFEVVNYAKYQGLENYKTDNENGERTGMEQGWNRDGTGMEQHKNKKNNGNNGENGKNDKKTSALNRQVSDYFCQVHQKNTGAKYLFEGAKDGTALSKLLKTYDYDFMTDFINWYFETDDKFINEAGRKISMLPGQVAKYIQSKNSKPIYSDTRVAE